MGNFADKFRKFVGGGLEKGEKFLGSKGNDQKPEDALPDNNIFQHRFDKRIWREVREDTPRIDSLLKDAPDGFNSLLEDLFSIYYKGTPRMRDEDTVSEEAKKTRQFSEEILNHNETRATRISTQFDEMLSAISMVAAGEEIKKRIQEQEPDGGGSGDGQNGEGEASDQQMQGIAQAAARAAQKEADDAQDAMDGWGLDSEALKKMDPDKRFDLIDALRRGRIRTLAELVGKMRRIANAARKEKIRTTTEEVWGVTTSGELTTVLPQEMSNLRHPLRKKDFYRRLMEGQLLSYDKTRYEELGKGPLVVLVDCSGSMQGSRIDAAVACAMALVQIATIKQRRRAAMVFFNGDIQKEIRFEPGEKDFDKIMELASVGASGGTDFDRPLKRSVEILQESKFHKGDVLMITDGQCHTSQQVLNEILEEKERSNFQIHSLALEEDESYRESLKAFSDRIFLVNDLLEQNSTVGDIAVGI